jgi:virginiamycin B lyase
MTSQILAIRSLVLIAALVAVLFVGSAAAQTPTPVALAGKVTSLEEGAMEGVLVSAKRADSTITVTVVSNDTGEYSFPRERFEPGQ